MKKLVLSLSLFALLATSLGGAAFAQARQEASPVLSPEEIHGSAPAQPDASESMYPAVHALVMAMTENHLDYDPEDPEFLWTSLYYMLSLYGQRDERAEVTDDSLLLPGEVIRLYSCLDRPHQVNAALVAGGVALYGAERKNMNLEDYFLNLIGGARHG